MAVNKGMEQNEWVLDHSFSFFLNRYDTKFDETHNSRCGNCVRYNGYSEKCFG